MGRHDCEMERVVAVLGFVGCDDLIPQHIRHRMGHAIGVRVTMSTPVPSYYPGFVLRHRVNQNLHQSSRPRVPAVERINSESCASIISGSAQQLLA